MIYLGIYFVGMLIAFVMNMTIARERLFMGGKWVILSNKQRGELMNDPKYMRAVIFGGLIWPIEVVFITAVAVVASFLWTFGKLSGRI